MDNMVEVILNLPESSIRKVRSLAMLAGITVGDVESQMAQMFDDMLSHNIRRELNRVDGVDPDGYETDRGIPKATFVARVTATETVRAGDALKVVAEPVEHTAAESDTDHALSGDDDDGSTKSVEDQVKELVDAGVLPDTGDEQFKINLSVPDVGDNAEAFADAAMRAPQQPRPQQQQQQPRTRAARTAFDPRAPRVRILATSEDEENDSAVPLGFQ